MIPSLAKSISVASLLLLFAAIPAPAEAHTVYCTGDPITGGVCLILCGVEHTIFAPPHNCYYNPSGLLCNELYCIALGP